MTGQGIRELLHLGADPASPHFIIFAEQATNRLHYACRFIFDHVLKVKYTITSGIEEFEASHFYRIKYSPEIIDNAFRIIPSGLLFEKGVPKDQPPIVRKNGYIYFYSNNEGDLHFDIFSAVFFMIARCEEWQPFIKDKHGRFELEQSILFRSNVHLKPVVDIWIMELRKAIAHFFPGIILPVLKSHTVSTIDVDNLYAYAGKGFVRTMGASVRDLFKGDLSNLKRRLKVLRSREKDPFDIYRSFTNYCKNINVPVFYFFLYRTGTEYDRTVDPASGAFRKVFHTIKNEGGNIGIHPSYYSSSEPALLQHEIKNISASLHEPVAISRQHYLKFDIRTTPRALLKNGILADFSMGFASGVGFRAGTSNPFYYYDLQKDEETELLFVPFCAMDGAYTVYEKVDPLQAKHSLEQLKKNVQAVNGLFVTVFHERTFAEHLYPGYAAMYKDILAQNSF
jgi:hypothetical protein